MTGINILSELSPEKAVRMKGIIKYHPVCLLSSFSRENLVNRHWAASSENVPSDMCEDSDQPITKIYLHNFDPLKPHFYTVQLGFTGVYIIFLISAQKHRLWVLVRTASMFWAEMLKISEFLSENFQFLEVKFSIYLNRRVFVMGAFWIARDAQFPNADNEVDLSLRGAHLSRRTFSHITFCLYKGRYTWYNCRFVHELRRQRCLHGIDEYQSPGYPRSRIRDFAVPVPSQKLQNVTKIRNKNALFRL